MKMPPRSMFCLGALITALAASPGYAQEEASECVAPQAPSIPDGRRSRESEMQETYTAVQDYLAAAENYRACLQKLLASHETDKKENKKPVAIVNEMINESLEIEQLVADTFNRELRAYKAEKK